MKKQLSREEFLQYVRENVKEKWKFMLPVLEVQAGVFTRNISTDLRHGIAPTGRAYFICGELYARSKGKIEGTKEYQDAVDEFMSLTI